MAIITTQYRFTFSSQRREVIDIHLDAETLERIDTLIHSNDLPAWTRLEIHQCPHCPLRSETHSHCPLAACLADIITRFDGVVSYDELDVEVITAERRVLQHTTAQNAISSLMGLLCATSGCPHTAYFKPMARFHLPLASEQDTIFRATGMYLLAQYFLKNEGQAADMELAGLTKIYDILHTLNVHLAQRLRDATQTDSSINAVILLDMFANALPFVIEERLDEIRPMFAPYLSEPFLNLLANLHTTPPHV